MLNRLYKNLVRDLFEAIDRGYLAELDLYVSEDFVDHTGLKDREGWHRAIATLHHEHPDMKYVLGDMIAEGDRVAVRARACGVKGGRLKTYESTGIYRIAHGKIVERWAHGDVPHWVTADDTRTMGAD